MTALVMGENFIRTLFAKNVRHKAMYGGRGSGKTWSIGSYLVHLANTERKRIICARQFQNSIRDSSKDLIERRIRDFELDQKFSVTDRSITHRKTGSEFLFIGLERNIESIRSLEGADVVWVDGHSDYGHAFEVWHDRHIREVTRKSSIILLGDARNNYHASQAWTLGEMRKKARRLFWLDPEPRGYWDTGDSIVSEYGKYCDGVFECRNLRQLTQFVATIADG